MRRAITPEARAHKKEIILDCARKLFLVKGFVNTTIELIMQQAGFSTGTFYLYFKTKTEIFKELLSRGIDILDHMFIEAMGKKNNSAYQRILNVAMAYLDFFKQNNEYFEIIALISIQSDDLRERESEISGVIDQKNLIILKRIESIIIEGQSSGEFYNADPWMTTTMLWGMMDGVLLLAKRGNLKTIQIDLDILIEQSLKIFFRGIQKR